MKIYIRKRQKIGEGVKQPQFMVVAISGDGSRNLRINAKHLRKYELDRIASDLGAEIIELEHPEEKMK